MGIFDAFTGAPAKEAAQQNRLLLQQNQASGTNVLQQGQAGALGALDQAGGYYQPLATKYGAATSLGLDGLGVNGPQGNARATGAFQAGPGYQYAVDQSLDGINRHAAAVGGAQGNTLAALSDRAGNMANQEYGSWLDRLNGYVSPELQATSGMAGAAAAKSPVYQNTAYGIAGLGNLTTNGINSQNTQAANAEMAGNANMWNFGMNAAKAVASGGTSLLGGMGGTPDYGQSSNVNVGGYSMPMFGRG